MTIKETRIPRPTGTEATCFRISPEASRAIDGWAWGLAAGSLRLWQLPDAINTLYQVAFEEGRRSREPEVQHHRRDADRLWLRAFGDEARRDYLLARLDEAAELSARPDVDDVLDEAWRTYLAGLDNIREPLRLPATSYQRKEAAA